MRFLILFLCLDTALWGAAVGVVPVYREYTDRQGNKFKAQIVELQRDVWCFVLEDGTRKKIEPFGLSTDDMAYLREEVGRRIDAPSNPEAAVLSTLGVNQSPAVPTTGGTTLRSYGFTVTWSDAHSDFKVKFVSSNLPEAHLRTLPPSTEERLSASVHPDKLDKDSTKFYIMDMPYLRVCNIKVTNRSSGDVGNLVVRYKVLYYKDGTRSAILTTPTEEGVIPFVKAGQSASLVTKQVPMMIKTSQRKGERGLAVGPIARSYGKIEGIPFELLHNGKVVHTYDSSKR